MFRNLLIFLFLACINTTLKAQPKNFEMLEVDIILMPDVNHYMEFYKQIENDKYAEIFLDEDEDDEGYFFYEKDTSIYENHTYSWEELQKQGQQIVHVEDLPSASENDFRKQLEHHWVVQDTSLSKTEKVFYMTMENDFIIRSQMEFMKVRQPSYFGAYEHQQNPDSLEWRDTRANFFKIAFMTFRNNKKLMLLLEYDGHIVDVVQVKNDKLVFLSEKYSVRKENLIAAEQLRTEFYQYFPTQNWYVITYDEKTGKYGLDSWFKETIFPKQYDTLTYSRTFIITEKEGQVDIYRTNLEKVEIPNVLKAYPIRSGLEILSSSSAFYYNTNLEVIEEFPPISYILCGTVSGTFSEVSLYKKRHASLKVETSNTGDYEKKLILPLELPYKKVDSLHFLNGTKDAWWTENSRMTNSQYMNPELLRFCKKGKYGILEYDLLLSYYFEYNSSYVLKDTIKSRYRDEILYTPYFPDSLTEVLPAKYTNIKFNNDNGLIYLHKRNKIGFYPQQIQPIYTQFEAKTNSFYVITREGRKGWIDIKEWKEYFWE